MPQILVTLIRIALSNFVAAYSRDIDPFLTLRTLLPQTLVTLIRFRLFEFAFGLHFETCEGNWRTAPRSFVASWNFVVVASFCHSLGFGASPLPADSTGLLQLGCFALSSSVTLHLWGCLRGRLELLGSPPSLGLKWHLLVVHLGLEGVTWPL